MSYSLDIDHAGTSLSLSDRSNGYRLVALDVGNPEPESQWATSVDTEGSRRASTHEQNRTVTARVIIEKSTDSALQTAENTLGQKIGKLYREGGTLRRTDPSGSTITFDVLEAKMVRVFTPQSARAKLAEYELTFLCKPYGYGAEQDLGDNVETTLPALVFTEASIPGDVPALGRLVIDDDGAADQFWLTWGIQSRYYSSASTAALFYQAESLSPFAGSATASPGPTGASGSGVLQNTNLGSTYLAVLSTFPGGAHLSHVGTYRVYTRMQVPTSNTGEVSVALQWTEGDFFNYTINTPVVFEVNDPREGSWVLVDLGLVFLPPVAQGTQRWEGRFIAKSTVAGDDVFFDCVFMVPVDEGSGIVRGRIQYEVASAFTARDEFNQTAGALTGKTLPVGGTWVGAGDADDFSVNATTHTADRTAVSDAAGTGPVNGRLVQAGTTNYTNIFVEVSASYTGSGIAAPVWGLVARYTDANNYASAHLFLGNTSSSLLIAKKVAGTDIVLNTVTSPGLGVHPPGTTKKMRLLVDDQGRMFVWLWDEDSTPGTPIAIGQHADLATGGTLATGKIGFFDYYLSATACTRTYDNFAAAEPTKDAAIFASQSLTVAHNRVEREDSAGVIWAKASRYEGDYLLVPASGAEGRTTRAIIKASRNDPEWGSDSAIDDISARLFVTPRYYVVPT